MSQTVLTHPSGQASRRPGLVRQRGRLSVAVLFVLILLPCAAFPQEFRSLNALIGSALSERSEPIGSFDKVRFSFSPELRLSGTPLLRDEKSLLAQTINAPLPNANLNLTTAAPQWGAEKSYLIPALEIVGFDVLLNLFDRVYFGCCDYDVDLSSIKRNLRRGWQEDRDEFTVNQLGHPYQGSMYHGFARASGLGFWEGMGYTFLGSAFWEIAGETTPPSRNDQITTGIGGAFLGEAMFRMANLELARDPS